MQAELAAQYADDNKRILAHKAYMAEDKTKRQISVKGPLTVRDAIRRIKVRVEEESWKKLHEKFWEHGVCCYQTRLETEVRGCAFTVDLKLISATRSDIYIRVSTNQPNLSLICQDRLTT